MTVCMPPAACRTMQVDNHSSCCKCLSIQTSERPCPEATNAVHLECMDSVCESLPEERFWQVSILEMDGQFDKIEELIYVESHLSNTSAKFYGEITQQMLKNSQFPGSTNGTGLFQTIVGLKIREVYEAVVETSVKAAV